MSKMDGIMSSLLRDYANKLDAGCCSVPEDELKQIMESMVLYDTTLRLSKDQARTELGLSRSRFDDYVRSGVIPKGKKTQGFKELTWARSEIILAKDTLEQLRHGETLH